MNRQHHGHEAPSSFPTLLHCCTHRGRPKVLGIASAAVQHDQGAHCGMVRGTGLLGWQPAWPSGQAQGWCHLLGTRHQAGIAAAAAKRHRACLAAPGSRGSSNSQCRPSVVRLVGMSSGRPSAFRKESAGATSGAAAAPLPPASSSVATSSSPAAALGHPMAAPPCSGLVAAVADPTTRVTVAAASNAAAPGREAGGGSYPRPCAGCSGAPVAHVTVCCTPPWFVRPAGALQNDLALSARPVCQPSATPFQACEGCLHTWSSVSGEQGPRKQKWNAVSAVCGDSKSGAICVSTPIGSQRSVALSMKAAWSAAHSARRLRRQKLGELMGCCVVLVSTAPALLSSPRSLGAASSGGREPGEPFIACTPTKTAHICVGSDRATCETLGEPHTPPGFPARALLGLAAPPRH